MIYCVALKCRWIVSKTNILTSAIKLHNMLFGFSSTYHHYLQGTRTLLEKQPEKC
jgi:hypothetical protein